MTAKRARSKQTWHWPDAAARGGPTGPEAAALRVRIDDWRQHCAGLCVSRRDMIEIERELAREP